MAWKCDEFFYIMYFNYYYDVYLDYVEFQWSHHSSHFMVSGNGDTGGYLPLKCEYQSDIDDDDDDENDIPNENDFIAPIDYIDPVSQQGITVFSYWNMIHSYIHTN